MHHALTIPELLHEIFQHVSDEDLGRNVSTVCKQWVDVSVRIVWRTLYDLTPLLRLVGEIEWEDHLTPGNDFVNTCKFRSLHGDWTRFDFYNRHVRILYLETGTNYQPALSAFAMLRSGTIFLPNLQEFEWRGYREDWMASVFVMHNSVTAFSLWVEYGFSEEQVGRYFDFIVARMPHLEHLYISGMNTEDTSQFSRALELLVPRLTDLKYIQFPAFNNTFPIISATSSLSRITNIRIDDGPSSMPLLPSAPPCILPPRLEILHITMAFRDAARLFHTALPYLSDITLVSRQAEVPLTVSHLTGAISQSCRNLRKLHLESAETRQGGPAGQVVVGVADDCVTIADIAPLFSCSAMKRFSIQHAYPLPLHDSDIRTLLTKWPALEILELNSFPSSSLAQGVSVPLPNWSTLALFARYGRHLFSLGLYMNGGGNVPNVGNSYPFRAQLEVFRMGGSLTNRGASSQARFLSYILPPGCTLFTPFTQVPKLVSEFQQVRAEEREAKNQLEREVIELRARLASLESLKSV
ncbi:hypothetical protein ARMSODRAFT_1078649 [Armillaria solidipes]|uniref:F-box domain-containing protein n=1 Tax=Armillaria solidipes TaxID=1076256 RepID=A0A2H3C0A1_9AGAR|nr:hypothetical protein ARMSODRAFT_1078649 [Armillaria solidipes]